ncbi:hypothetical protein Dimus_022708 [Dionaea muscipula]
MEENVDENPKNETQEGVSRDNVEDVFDVEKDEEKDEEKNEDVVNDHPKDDISVGISRGEMGMDVNDIVADPRDDIFVGVSRDVIDLDEDNTYKHGWETVVYQGEPTAQAQPVRSDLYEHIEQAVKCIFEGMDQWNKGIKELSEHQESKTFTDNQKEKLTWVKLNEIKNYLSNLSEELNNLSIFLKKTMFQVADLISEKIKDQTSPIQLKIEENGMDLKHLVA